MITQNSDAMKAREIDESTPIFQLTVGEYKKLHEEIQDCKNKEKDSNDKWFNIREAAKYVGCGESTIRKHLYKIKRSFSA